MYIRHIFIICKYWGERGHRDSVKQIVKITAGPHKKRQLFNATAIVMVKILVKMKHMMHGGKRLAHESLIQTEYKWRSFEEGAFLELIFCASSVQNCTSYSVALFIHSNLSISCLLKKSVRTKST